MVSNKTIFFVVGRLGESLVYSKIVPFIKTGYFDKIYCFKETEGIKIGNVEYRTLPIWIKKIKIGFIKKLIRQLYEPIQLLIYTLKYKPVYINGIFTLPKGLNAVIVGLLTGTKSIVSVIGGTIEIDTYYKFKLFWMNLNLWMLKTCDIVTTKGSKITKYLIENGIDEKKIFEFNGFINTKTFCISKRSEREIDILFVGTFRRLKGPDKIVKIIKRLSVKFPNIIAIFLGDGYLFNQVKKQIITLGLTNNIFLKGHVKDTVKFYQKAKILVIPSRSEGLSTSMLEAMACGCVPVVSNVGNMTEAAHNEINSFVVDDYTDIDTFVKYVKILLENSNRRDEMAQNAIQTVKTYYSLLPQTMIAKQIIDYGKKL